MTDKNDHVELHDENEENFILNPKEVEERKKRRVRGLSVQPSETTAVNRAGRVVVNLESKGRFGSPVSMTFSDFLVQHVTDISLSNTEDLIETTISILNEIKNKDCEFDLINLTLEEMLEILLAIKLQFNTSQHTHRWICPCQYNLPEESIQYSEAIIDLKTINYRSIEKVDEELKKLFKEKFDVMNEDAWATYIDFRYGDEKNPKQWTKEEELNSITVKEPFNYIHPTTKDIYSFRLMRVADLINAKKLANSMWNNKIVAVKNRPIPAGVAIAKAKEEKEEEIKKLQKAETKDAITFANAATLIGFNGEELSTLEKKVDKYLELTRDDQFKFSEFLRGIEFGIYDERELVCNLCGKTERRVLQQDTTPIELLPLDANTSREQRKSAKLDFYFGI